MSRKKKVLAAVVYLSTAGLLGAAPAFAVSASISGSSAYTNSSGSYTYNGDTKDDGQFTSTLYIEGGKSGEQSLVNKSGAFTTVSRYTGGGVGSVKACVSRTALPMACSPWNGAA
jgi:hypothetical protein